MQFDLVHIWHSMGLLSKIIAGVLACMMIASVGVCVERLIAFTKGARETRRFAQALMPLVERWELQGIVALAARHDGSALARLLGSVTKRYDRAIEDLVHGLTPVELARNEADRQREKIAAELRRGMSVIASVGSVAPFVGLLGTVMGIIASFQGIGGSGSAGLAAVSSGIAEALVETAFGLLVAIPAVLMFNYLSTRVAAIELALGRAVGELLDEMENHYGSNAQPERRLKSAA